MIDDKEIEEAAQGAADLYEQDLPVMSYNGDTEVDGQHHFCQEFGAELFKNGVKWCINKFLKNLWHTANEKPKEFNHYGFAALYILQSNHQIRMVLYDKDNMSWKNVISINEYWLYVDDLLPKEGGEQ